MMPEERMISAVSSIIVSSDAIDTFLWRKLRELIPEQTYTTLIKTTVSRYVAVRGNYLQATNKIQELLGDQELSNSYLAQMLVRHHLKTQTFPLDQIAKAE